MVNQTRQIRKFLFIAGILASANAAAQQIPVLTCEPCRNPNVHPSDFGNYAYNAARKPDNGYTYDQIDNMLVRNLRLQWAFVDLDFDNFTLPIGEIGIPIPNGMINITVTDQNGNVTTYPVDHKLGEDLTVGSGTGPGYDPAAEAYADNNDALQYSESGEEGPGLEMVQPGVYNGDSWFSVDGIGIPDNGNYCGPGTDYICVF